MPVDFAEIRRRREKIGLTQQEAAARAGWTGPNDKVRWFDLEKGKYPDPQISTLEAAARALECSVQDLLVREPTVLSAQRRRRPSGAAGSKG